MPSYRMRVEFALLATVPAYCCEFPCTVGPEGPHSGPVITGLCVPYVSTLLDVMPVTQPAC